MSLPQHPLRRIRAATPHPGRAAFAAWLGVPEEVVRAVESGRALATARLAALVREKTGADDTELLCGFEGKARGVDGRRYTLQTYLEWQGSARQAEEQKRREGQMKINMSGWEEHRRAAPDGDLHGEDLEAVEDELTPWQRSEFTSAVAKQWRRLPEERRQACGWSPSLEVPKEMQLTLSVMTAPRWQPLAVPPRLLAANEALFPSCCYTVAAGSGGCRIAAAFWRALCREQAVDCENGLPLYGTPAGNWRGFFRSRGKVYEPHAVFAGLEKAEAEEWPAQLFPEDGLLCGAPTGELAAQVLTFMENHCRDAGSPGAILLFVSLEGENAGLLSGMLLTRLRERFPAIPLIVAGVLPLDGVSRVVTAPWHIALAMQAIRRHASLGLLFSNDHLLAEAERDWAMASPHYAEANLLIAECLSAVTAPLRFGGHDTPPVEPGALVEALRGSAESAAGATVLTGQCRPLAALVEGRDKTVPLSRLVRKALKRSAGGVLSPGEQGTLAAFFKVRTEPEDGWFYRENDPPVTVTGRREPGRHESVTVLAASAVIRRKLRSLARQARQALALPAAERHSTALGVTMEELREAIREMAVD